MVEKRILTYTRLFNAVVEGFLLEFCNAVCIKSDPTRRC